MSTGRHAILKYFPKVSSGTIPAATTPDTEPIRRSEPPVPTVRAVSTQSWGFDTLMISIASAVRGTLSTTEDMRPMKTLPMTTRRSVGAEPKSAWERNSSAPVTSSAHTARSIPMKNLIEERSVFWRSFSREVSSCSSNHFVQFLKYSTMSHTIPSPRRSQR